MPPSLSQKPIDTGHMLPEHTQHRSGVGPWVGAIIIVILLGFGALYFWGEYLNNRQPAEELPFIQGNL